MFEKVMQRQPDAQDADRMVWYGFIAFGDRYYFDNLLTAADGWMQYDTSQDAWYFGVWVNPKTLQVVTYAEGDVTLEQATSPEAFNRIIDKMNDFYEPAPWAISIDADGSRTDYYQDRSIFKVEV